MPDVAISIASGGYDRIRAIRDGTVKVEGCTVTYHVVEPNQLFVRNLTNQEFDVSEMSFSTYIALRDQGRAHYTAIPVFLSRAFRHSAIFVRSGRGIASPADLKGKRVGTPEYFTTMLVWLRGILSDEYGITSSDLRWRLGPLEPQVRQAPPEPSPAQLMRSPAHQSHRGQKPISVSGGEKNVEIEIIPAGKSLAGMLAAGELDAVFSARSPSCFQQTEQGKRVVRLFPDYRAAEQDYYRKTGVYPLMHAVGIRNSLMEQHPWIAEKLFHAFARAKDIAVADFEKLSAFALTMPWIEAEYRATQAVLGEDIWPYGVEANRKAIHTLCRYLHEQGFTGRRMSIDGLFASGFAG